MDSLKKTSNFYCLPARAGGTALLAWTMSYAALCTFDLDGASSADYQNAYADLEKSGLRKAQDNSGGGATVIPRTTGLGSYNGVNVSTIRDDLLVSIRTAFSARGFRSEIFILVGGTDWTWGAQTS